MEQLCPFPMASRKEEHIKQEGAITKITIEVNDERKPCIKEECVLYRTVKGTDPNTGKDVDHGDCSLRWTPLLQMETSREIRLMAGDLAQTRKLIESVVAIIASHYGPPPPTPQENAIRQIQRAAHNGGQT